MTDLEQVVARTLAPYHPEYAHDPNCFFCVLRPELVRVLRAERERAVQLVDAFADEYMHNAILRADLSVLAARIRS